MRNIKKFYSVLDNGNQIDIDMYERNLLVRKKYIYRCKECGNGMYHIEDGHSFEEIEKLLDSLNK